MALLEAERQAWRAWVGSMCGCYSRSQQGRILSTVIPSAGTWSSRSARQLSRQPCCPWEPVRTYILSSVSAAPHTGRKLTRPRAHTHACSRATWEQAGWAGSNSGTLTSRACTWGSGQPGCWRSPAGQIGTRIHPSHSLLRGCFPCSSSLFLYLFKIGRSGLVHWDDPEGWDGEGGGRGVQDGGRRYTHGWFMWMYGKTH